MLKLPYEVTKNYQKAELTAGPFYKGWKQISCKFTTAGGPVADGIQRSMQKREATLMNKSVLLAAIYVDPMHTILLTGDQTDRGKLALCEVAIRIKILTDTIFQDSEIESCSARLFIKTILKL